MIEKWVNQVRKTNSFFSRNFSIWRAKRMNWGHILEYFG
jgi:hypothetical protein